MSECCQSGYQTTIIFATIFNNNFFLALVVLVYIAKTNISNPFINEFPYNVLTLWHYQNIALFVWTKLIWAEQLVLADQWQTGSGQGNPFENRHYFCNSVWCKNYPLHF